MLSFLYLGCLIEIGVMRSGEAELSFHNSGILPDQRFIQLSHTGMPSIPSGSAGSWSTFRGQRHRPCRRRN